jgi:hypothetical protein
VNSNPEQQHEQDKKTLASKPCFPFTSNEVLANLLMKQTVRCGMLRVVAFLVGTAAAAAATVCCKVRCQQL